MNVGEIFWVEFPTRGGRAQSGRRPAIVVQKEKSESLKSLCKCAVGKTAARQSVFK